MKSYNLIITILLATLVNPLFTQNLFSQSFNDFIINVEDDTINVNYNLNSIRADDVYKVDLTVSRNNGQSFDIIPRNIQGDIGYGIKSGLNKKIQWQPLVDSLELVGDDFIFRITAKLLGASDLIELVRIPCGSYTMGNTFPEGRSDENYPHLVNLDAFEIGIYEITNVQFAIFLYRYGSEEVKSGEFVGEPMIYEHERGLKNNPSNINRNENWIPQKGYEYYPVVNVTWYGANEFCKYYGFRLPTEAEWEYAAREMGDTIRFGNGKNLARPNEINFNGHFDFVTKYSEAGENRQFATRIASFAPNKLELFDMSGNVWEWCQDWYASNYYFKSKTDNPTGPWFGNNKSIRGGSWYNQPIDIRVTDRSFLPPHIGRGDVGFRVAKSIKNN